MTEIEVYAQETGEGTTITIPDGCTITRINGVMIDSVEGVEKAALDYSKGKGDNIGLRSIEARKGFLKGVEWLTNLINNRQ